MSLAQDYDAIPYPNLSYIDTHPSRLATLATLMGMSPASAENCRVLEVGCASGGNLLPMAAHLPNSTFVGIDISGKQIDMANSKYSLDNITFQQMDIMDITPDFGQFDYIIAHGIYSWIPAEVQDKLLQVCNQNLAPQGIAYVSYNTLPGWHNLLMMREMMQYHMRDIDDRVEGTLDAMRLIHFLHDAQETRSETAYRAMLEAYLQTRTGIGLSPEALAASILHDELEAHNQPVYFHQFAEHVAQHQLQYVVEARIHTIMPFDLSQEIITHLNQMSRTVVEYQQYLDFIYNRIFRQSLLCHQDIALNRTLRPERIKTLLIGSKAHEVKDDNLPPNAKRFSLKEGKATIATDHPTTIAAIQHLINIYPQVISFEDLMSAASDSPSEQDEQILAGTLLQGFTRSGDLVELHSTIPEFTTDISDHPTIHPIARRECQDDKYITNMRHERIELDKMLRVIVPHMDGEHTQADLLQILMSDESIKFESNDGEVVTANEQRAQALSQVLDNGLKWLAKASLLVG